MDLEEGLLGLYFAALITLLIIFTGVVIYDAITPPETISLEEIGGYEGDYIETSAIATEVLDPKDTRFEFFILIPISTGKTIVLIPIPIYDDYKVYNTQEGIHFAIDKDGEQPKLLTQIIIRGTVLKDSKNDSLFCIKVGDWEYWNEDVKNTTYTSEIQNSVNFTKWLKERHPIINFMLWKLYDMYEVRNEYI